MSGHTAAHYLLGNIPSLRLPNSLLWYDAPTKQTTKNPKTANGAQIGAQIKLEPNTWYGIEPNTCRVQLCRRQQQLWHGMVEVMMETYRRGPMRTGLVRVAALKAHGLPQGGREQGDAHRQRPTKK